MCRLNVRLRCCYLSLHAERSIVVRHGSSRAVTLFRRAWISRPTQSGCPRRANLSHARPTFVRPRAKQQYRSARLSEWSVRATFGCRPSGGQRSRSTPIQRYRRVYSWPSFAPPQRRRRPRDQPPCGLQAEKQTLTTLLEAAWQAAQRSVHRPTGRDRTNLATTKTATTLWSGP